ncbi:hypothetical protein GE061_011253 [Apolygus lucorum]|uniref:Uncharacterized protein n=1 Tax=Apolygus lucorum TaxID=248454 RepID=A0A8S9XX74_APOLU|nr:hypothetical protein GE061_011253 [Apolygus lucorum]
MKTFTFLLCLAAVVAAVVSSPTKNDDKELEGEWNKHKDSIMKRLEENHASLETQYKIQLDKVKSSNGAEKESAQQKADTLKQEIQKSKLVISRLKET